MEGFKNNNDGLDFICEICMDREGGCSACGFGQRQKTQKKESEEPDNSPMTDEEIKEFFKDFKGSNNKK